MFPRRITRCQSCRNIKYQNTDIAEKKLHFNFALAN